MIQPRLQISVLQLYSLLPTTSGDENKIVPTFEWFIVFELNVLDIYKILYNLIIKYSKIT
jgi:hypothetical protein